MRHPHQPLTRGKGIEDALERDPRAPPKRGRGPWWRQQTPSVGFRPPGRRCTCHSDGITAAAEKQVRGFLARPDEWSPHSAVSREMANETPESRRFTASRLKWGRSSANGVRCSSWPCIQSRPKARNPPTRGAREARSLRRRSLTAGPAFAGSTSWQACPRWNPGDRAGELRLTPLR
jgi:hypothetical protein